MRIETFQFQSRGLGFVGHVYLDRAEAVSMAKAAERDRLNASASTHAGYGYPIPQDVGDYAEDTQ